MRLKPSSAHSVETWLLSAGIRSARLFQRSAGSWKQLSSLGEQQAEAPWDLISAEESELLLDESACASRLDLRAAGVRAAALVELRADLRVWLTSTRRGWFPSSDVIVALGWLGEAGLGSFTQSASSAATASSAGIAHDLRNQLSLALLRLEMVETADGSEVDAVRGALRSGRAMCNAFLGSEESHSDHLLGPMIEQEVRGAVDFSSQRKVQVAVRCGAQVLIHAPESALRRFVHNATMNAIEASPDGSKIIVEAMHAEPGRVQICVEDSGVGLTSAGVADSFAPGVSGRGSTGIGTASLREAASALGSPLVVSTALGAGTRVSVTVSAARADRPVAVLLDSDPILGVSARESLEDRGWWVIHEVAEDAAISAVDRFGAQLCLARRGAPGGGVAALRVAADDLDVAFSELTRSDVEPSLPCA